MFIANQMKFQNDLSHRLCQLVEMFLCSKGAIKDHLEKEEENWEISEVMLQEEKKSFYK
jgi:hypothetical protein